GPTTSSSLGSSRCKIRRTVSRASTTVRAAASVTGRSWRKARGLISGRVSRTCRLLVCCISFPVPDSPAAGNSTAAKATRGTVGSNPGNAKMRLRNPLLWSRPFPREIEGRHCFQPVNAFVHVGGKLEIIEQLAGAIIDFQNRCGRDADQHAGVVQQTHA